MKQFIVLFTLALMFACSGHNGNESNVPVVELNDSAMVANGYDVVELHKMKTGHITATFKVNGKPCQFLVDTGGGGTLIDMSKKDKYGLEALGIRDYAAGIGSVSSLVRTSATLQIGGKDIKSEDLFLMDISYINAEFRKTKGRQVDGVLGTDFFERHHTVIDYPHSKMYLVIEPDGEE
ncbi:MAG: clan AA aspartic protease [Prevotella sp.]|nr:clan AA aspartic protease [Prevotella sp.]